MLNDTGHAHDGPAAGATTLTRPVALTAVRVMPIAKTATDTSGEECAGCRHPALVMNDAPRALVFKATKSSQGRSSFVFGSLRAFGAGTSAHDQMVDDGFLVAVSPL